MLNYRYIILVLSFVFLQSSCLSSSQKQREQVDSIKLFPRPLPKVPSSITEAKAQSKYMLAHFWDKFDFSHEDILKNKDSFEESFANYFGLLTSLDSKEVSKELLYPLKNSLDSILKEELRLYRKYLYEADSPMLSNELYEEVLKWILKTPRTNALQKEEARLLLEIITKNKVGAIATNFVYQTADGSKHHLKNLLSPYSLLVFAKADCPTCEVFTQQLISSKELEQELQKLKLQIVLIYLDKEVPQAKLERLPKSIIAGFDYKEDILQKQLYDIKSTPTFYLLKRGGEVLLKETSPDEVLEYIKQKIK